MPTRYTNAISSTSAATEFRRRTAEAMASVEPRPGPLGNQAAVEELPGHRAHPLVHHQLRHDEQGQRQQEPGVHLDVRQEGHPDRVAPRAPAQHRQDQQREPREERDHDDPAAQQLQRVAGQTSARDKLEQRGRPGPAEKSYGSGVGFASFAAVLLMSPA